MKFILIFFSFFMFLSANSFNGFLERIYSELSELDLSSNQEQLIKNTIKSHHLFLKDWHIKVKKNNEKIMKKFSDSTLKKDSEEFNQDKILLQKRTIAERNFIVAIYNILNDNQRKIMYNKLQEQKQGKIFGFDSAIKEKSIQISGDKQFIRQQ
ncbi:MAG: hypothetical protein K2P17_06195 [Helicobacteraceae bacterium]|nr:hypothetical protein [Helicobacteraceae bacterium]